MALSQVLVLSSQVSSSSELLSNMTGIRSCRKESCLEQDVVTIVQLEIVSLLPEEQQYAVLVMSTEHTILGSVPTF